MTLSAAELDDLKDRPENDCAKVAGKLVRLRKRGGRIVGPCPLCSTNPQSKNAMRFEIKNGGWVCAVCRDGGDVIKLVRLHQGLDFRAAVEWLGGARQVDPAIAERRARERAEQQAKRDADSEHYRHNERKGMYQVWNHAVRELAGTPVHAYLKLRIGDDVDLSALRVRFVDDMPYYYGKDAQGHQRIIHRGPAMVVPLIDNVGKFRGCQFTWIDLSMPKGKARIIDPETGEVVNEKGRKSRGSTKAAHIDLIGPRNPEQVIAGEGTETTISVWHAMSRCGIDLSRTAFWALIDLGNIGGRATEQIRYRDLDGKAKQCPGPDPDLEEAGVALPESVRDAVLLGDGTSDPLLTHCALYRGAQRFLALNSTVLMRVAWADEGMDFNDMVRGENETTVTKGV